MAPRPPGDLHFYMRHSFQPAPPFAERSEEADAREPSVPIASAKQQQVGGIHEAISAALSARKAGANAKAPSAPNSIASASSVAGFSRSTSFASSIGEELGDKEAFELLADARGGEAQSLSPYSWLCLTRIDDRHLLQNMSEATLTRRAASRLVRIGTPMIRSI